MSTAKLKTYVDGIVPVTNDLWYEDDAASGIREFLLVVWRAETLEKDALVATANAARNKLNKDIEKLKKKHVELLAYDEKLWHYADLPIQLDLDDGVKAVTGGSGDD